MCIGPTSRLVRLAVSLAAGCAAAMLALTLCAPAGAVATPRPVPVVLTGSVSDVVDGDTVKVVVKGFETTVRLIGIDTPETRDPSLPVQCFGPQATARTKRLLPVGRRVRLVSDPMQALRDRYGRLLAYVYNPGRSGPTGSVNFSLVRSGHARAYIFGGVRFRHAVPFLRAQSRARSARAGLWGPPCRGNTTTPDPSTRVAAPAPVPEPTPAPAPAVVAPTEGGACDPNYAGACIATGRGDIDCNEIPDRDFRVVGEDVHRFDVDHDGIACEG